MAAKQITASLTGSVDKTYDATRNATLSSGNYSLSGVIGSDSAQLNNPTSGLFDDKNAGTGKIVFVFGLGLSGVDAGNYTLASTSVSGSIGQIEAKGLSVLAASQNKKSGQIDPIYTYTYSGLVGGESSANFTGSLGRAAGESAGSYEVNLNTLAALGNYRIGSFTPGLLVIENSVIPVPTSVMRMSYQPIIIDTNFMRTPTFNTPSYSNPVSYTNPVPYNSSPSVLQIETPKGLVKYPFMEPSAGLQDTKLLTQKKSLLFKESLKTMLPEKVPDKLQKN